MNKLKKKIRSLGTVENEKEKTRNTKNKYQKRLKLINHLIQNKYKPTWIMIKYLPVLPPSLRPIIKMQDNTIIISDLNYIYSEIININNKLIKFKELSIPEILMIKEKLALQMSINKLMNNKSKKKYASNVRKQIKNFLINSLNQIQDNNNNNKFK